MGVCLLVRTYSHSNEFARVFGAEEVRSRFWVKYQIRKAAN
jgi:hypothetical protein